MTATANKIQKGAYVNIEENDNGILLTLTPEGREELLAQQVNEREWGKGTNEIFLDLIEDHLANGLDVIQPEEIGALTSSLILSYTAVHDDEGKLQTVDTVYWFPDYCIKCELEEMLDNDGVQFTLVEGEDNTIPLFETEAEAESA